MRYAKPETKKDRTMSGLRVEYAQLYTLFVVYVAVLLFGSWTL